MNMYLQIRSSSKADSEDVRELPHDIILNILARTPADFLRKRARYVCKAWQSIPRNPQFIIQHFRHSKPGIYCQDNRTPNRTRFIEFKDKKVQELDEWDGLPMGRICDSQDGILLIYDISYPNQGLYIANPVTRQVLNLSTFSVTYDHIYHAKIGRVYTGKYKVVFPGRNNMGYYLFYVLTLGATGRSNNNTTISLTKVGDSHLVGGLLQYTSVCVDGVLYWRSYNTDRRHLHVFDLNHSSTYYLELPNQLCEPIGLQKFKGDLCLSVAKVEGEIEFWVPKDIHKRVWERAQLIRVGQMARPCRYRTLGVSFLSAEEALVVFEGGCDMAVVFNVKTKESTVLGNIFTFVQRIGLHTKSLVTF